MAGILIKDGEALKPNFWRAPVDNDYGANLQRKYIAWKNPEIKLTSFKQRTENNQVIVESAYDMPGVSAKLNLVYVINNAGAVKVTQKLTATRMPKYRTCSVSVCRCLCRAALKPLNTMDAVRLKTILTVIIARLRHLSPKCGRAVLSLHPSAGKRNKDRYSLVEDVGSVW